MSRTSPVPSLRLPKWADAYQWVTQAVAELPSRTRDAFCGWSPLPPAGPIAVALTADITATFGTSTFGVVVAACTRANAFAAYAFPAMIALDVAAGSVPAAAAAPPCGAPASALTAGALAAGMAGDLPSAV